MSTFPKNRLAQIIISELVHAGITHAVISPGSRNAPLIIGLNSASEITSYSIADERSAGFFAMGIAQQVRQPVALVCTSGSALLNYYPAVAEAYYNQIPLLVISADRPKHLIDVGDGQTIRQENVFSNHSLKNVNMGSYDSTEEASTLREAILISKENMGPVHINVPFDEPLYEVTDENIGSTLPNSQKKNKRHTLSENERNRYANIWNTAEKKIVLVGSFFPNAMLQEQLEELISDPSVLVMIENTANVRSSKFINSIDKLIFPFQEDEIENFRPDILLTLGGMIVSKKIKQHLRKFPPKHHWHVDPLRAFDTFHCLEHHFKFPATEFFRQFFKSCKPVQSNYQQYWLGRKKIRLDNHDNYLKECEFSDLKVFDVVLGSLKTSSNLQLANSSVIRYTQLFDIDHRINVFCNRGTSGIDGSMSTAVGAACVVKKPTVFITGDISFFYDSNALWNNYLPCSFRIIVINNGGGGIFRFIPGPVETGALDLFETPHNLSAKHLCKMHTIDYQKASDNQSLNNELKTFYEASERPKLLEIFTPRLKNDMVLKSYFKSLNK